MGLLDGYGAAAAARLEALWVEIKCAFQGIAKTNDQVAAATTGTARQLAHQYGVPPEVGTPGMAPRSMTALPYIEEGDVLSTEPLKLDLFETQKRYAFAGYVANIGDEPIRAAWLSAQGSPSGTFTLPPNATVQVPCIVRGLVFMLPEGGAAGRYQVSLS